ncbi:MAG: hypothetical protein U0325_30275 [Polyangiales bacterium]
MRRLAASVALFLGCRGASPSRPDASVAPVALARPAEVLAWADAPAWDTALPRLRASGLVGPTAALTVLRALGVDARLAAALDPAHGANAAWTAGGWVFALPLRSATALDGLDGVRLREEPALGAWVERAVDAGAPRPCLLRAAPSPRLVCAGDVDTVRRVAPWLAAREGSRDDAVHVGVRDGALGPLVGAGVTALTAWLADEAARARAAHGPPTQGDPEGLIEALRGAGARWGAGAAMLRGVHATVRPVDDGLQFEIEATAGARVRRSAVTTPLRLEVPRRGLAWSWRDEANALQGAVDDLTDLALRVVGTRTPHGPRVRADLARWSPRVGETFAGSVAWQRTGASLALRVGMRDEAAANEVARELQASPWWGTGTGSVQAEAASLRVERGAVEHAAVSVQGDAFLAAVLRLGDEVREGCTAQAWRRGARVGVRVFLGAAWTRLADDERDR